MSDARKPSVLLVDGYSLIFRAFHALPLMVTKDGTYTNAVHGFFSMLLKALGDYRPDALCVMLDVHAPTFRHTLYPDYKGDFFAPRKAGCSGICCPHIWVDCGRAEWYVAPTAAEVAAIAQAAHDHVMLFA